MGPEFRANAVEVRAEREGTTIEGYAALPTLTRANSLSQYLFVNGRPVRDKLLLGVVRGAYADYLPRDRHPMVAMFVTLPPREVDVNVHPAKTEVRFRDAGLIRALVMSALKDALARNARRAATTGGTATLAAFRSAALPRAGFDWRQSPSRPLPLQGDPAAWSAPSTGFDEPTQAAFDV
jgi:DNA mismatch repair protein MutL